jgi:hypothetical protein
VLIQARKCFLDPVRAVGQADVTAPTLAGTACQSATVNLAVSAGTGLPGPMRITINTNQGFGSSLGCDDLGTLCSSAGQCCSGVCWSDPIEPGTQDKCCGPSCSGKTCGHDGCGGSCGTCGSGTVCVSGNCQCLPNCSGIECGDDGCGGSCGTCSPGENCHSSGVCVVS